MVDFFEFVVEESCFGVGGEADVETLLFEGQDVDVLVGHFLQGSEREDLLF